MVGGSAFGLVKNQPVENVRGAVELSRRGVRALDRGAFLEDDPGAMAHALPHIQQVRRDLH